MHRYSAVLSLVSAIVVILGAPGWPGSAEGATPPPTISPLPLVLQAASPDLATTQQITLTQVYIPFWAGPEPIRMEASAGPLSDMVTSSGPHADFVRRAGEELRLGGQPYIFAGVNIRYLNEPYFPEEEVEGIVANLSDAGLNAIRIWLTSDHDLDRFERLLDLGHKYEVRFVVTLVDYYYYKTVSWFKGTGRDEYQAHVQQVVERFRDRPEILMWELMNEPGCGPEGGSQKCMDTVYEWVADTSAYIKSMDPDHMISVGTQRAGWTEAEIAGYERMHALDTIDVVSVHKLASRDPEREVEIAAKLAKPVMIGELWSKAYKDNCQPLSGSAVSERAEKIETDLVYLEKQGVDGYLLWEYSHGAVQRQSGIEYFCSDLGYYAGDPAFEVLGRWLSGQFAPRVKDAFVTPHADE